MAKRMIYLKWEQTDVPAFYAVDHPPTEFDAATEATPEVLALLERATNLGAQFYQARKRLLDSFSPRMSSV